ncbi:MAG: replication-associated recombination protein A [Luteibaculaceae bacterium]
MYSIPLAERLRPKTLADYVGQEHLIGAKGSLTGSLKTGNIPSIILWGPPGVGKTTLAQLIAQELNRKLYIISAVNAGVKDIREVLDKAERVDMFSQQKPILFIDEIHRFSKSQQDSLLNAVEKGSITLIGATTENPSFEVISALLSRMQVYVLKNLEQKDLNQILERALKEDSVLATYPIQLKESEFLLQLSGGDARRLLNLVELVVMQLIGSADNKNSPIVIDNAVVKHLAESQPARYDKTGEQHYDIISALIKSIRGSDPQAAVYWLARMIEGGEKPEFIARRLVILAAEDIGLANPNALLMANSTLQSVALIGWPESRIILSNCVIYLATSAKSNAAYEAINKAQAFCKEHPNLAVPLHLRNAPTKLMKDIGYGAEYKYAHSYSANFVQQEYLPKGAENELFYTPGNNPKEQQSKAWIDSLWGSKKKS